MRKSIWLLSAGLFALSTPAYAQKTDTDGTAARPTDGATAEAGAVSTTATQTTAEPDSADIIVTATRRNEALSDVPLAVSAVTAESMQNTGASDIRQLQQVSPSLLVTSTQSEGGASTARIRGIGTVGDNPGLESSVGVFIDGVYRSRVGAGLTELGPVERVEILRGPQGTLFGRNTSAGLISIITAKPKFTPEVGGEATIGNYNLRRFELSATGPLSDTIAARIDGVYMKRDGFLEDLISGRDVNNRNRWLLRGQLMYQPSDDFSFRLVGDYSKRNEECCAAPYLPASDAIRVGTDRTQRTTSTIKPLLEGLGGIVPDDTYKRNVVISRGRSYRGDVKDYGLSGEGVYDFGGAELTSVTAYRYNNLVRGSDIDYSNLDLVYRPDDGTAFNRFKTFSQELRLQGEAFGGKLDWLVGGYYANEKLRSQDSLRYGRDYDALSSCLTAGTFAVLTGQPGIQQVSNPTCFNTPTATAVRNGLVAQFGLTPSAALAQTITTLAAFARLDNSAFAPAPINFSLPVFTDNGYQNLALATPQPNFLFQDEGFVDDFRQSSNNLALFTHNIFSITDALKLTIGARYTTETKKLRANLTDNNIACEAFTGTSLAQLPCASPSVTGHLLNLDGKKKEHKLSGTTVLSFKPTRELLTYISYSRGYKAGGYNLDRSALSRQLSLNSFGQQVAGQVCPISGVQPAGCTAASIRQLEFRPEINDSTEVGFKYNGRGVDVNVAIFHQLFRDFQLNTFNGVNFIVENVNSCSQGLNGADTDNVTLPAQTGGCTGKTRAGVKSNGVEFELFSRPVRDIAFNLGVTYVDTRYRNNLVGAGGRPLATALFQLPGRRLSNSSEATVTSSLAWTPAIGNSGLRGLAYIDMRHQSAFNTGSDLDIEKVENGYTTFNARVGLHGPNKMWAIELWAQNLFNADYKQIAFDAFLQGQCTERGAARAFCSPAPSTTRSNQLYASFLAEPRTFGLTLRGKFAGARRVSPVYVAPPAPLPAPAMQTCPDGSVIDATAVCPPLPAPVVQPVVTPERG